MLRRIYTLILALCLTAALLPHWNATAAGRKPECFTNSDVEAYIEEDLYGLDEAQNNRLYRESQGHTGKVYLTEQPVLQICAAGQGLFALTRESGKSAISCLDLETWQWRRVTETAAEISRFAVAGNRLYYLAGEAISYQDLDTGRTGMLLHWPGLSRFWLAGSELVDYMLEDGRIVYRYHTVTGETTSYTNKKSTLRTGTAAAVQSETSETLLTLDQLKEKFPDGMYWNHVGSPDPDPDGYTQFPCDECDRPYSCRGCVGNSDCTCNSFLGAWQCLGFVKKLAYDYFGSNTSDWTESYDLEDLQAGDVIRFRNDTHSIWVTAVDGDTVTYADCNFTGKCQIRWDGQLSKSTILESLSYVLSPNWSYPNPAPDPDPDPMPDPSPTPDPDPMPDPGPVPDPDPTPDPNSNPFVDLDPEQFYYTPVLWAVENGITAGVDATHFKPLGNCTRGQVVTFLWRAAGCPAPTSSICPFEDVAPELYYYQAILWAYENEIAYGVDSNRFDPNGTVTRGQFVTFLWRAEGQPPAEGENPFLDVSQDQFYYRAVLWAVQNEITMGTAPNRFQPDNPCTRSQVVTFLYRNHCRS